MALFPWAGEDTGTYVTVTDGIHGQQVISMSELKLHHLLSRTEIAQLLLLCLAALLDQVLQEKGVFAHPLDRFQQVGGQVHLIPQLHLLELRNAARVKAAASPRSTLGPQASTDTSLDWGTQGK